MLAQLPAAQWNEATAAHLLNRAGFGGGPQDIENLRLLGLDRAVQSLVNYGHIPDNTPPPDWAQDIDLDVNTRRDAIYQAANPDTRRLLQNLQFLEDDRQISELRYWWLRRMALGPRPFQEKMTLFWHGRRRHQVRHRHPQRLRHARGGLAQDPERADFGAAV